MRYSKIIFVSAAALLLMACSQKNLDPETDNDDINVTSWRDQTVEIILKEEGEEKGCIERLKLKQNAQKNNCDIVSINDVSDMAVMLKDCGSDPECVCTVKSKRVSWETSDNNTNFTIIFDYGEPSPFRKNCNLTSKKGGLKCTVAKGISAEIPYSVKLVDSECPKYDPRIVVRHQNGIE